VSAPDPLHEGLEQKLAAAQAEERMPSVSAAVFGGGEVVWQQALGAAAVEEGVEATPETQYRIGSITKTFTAVGVMQLRDEGALSLDDPLTAYLPESAHGPTIGRMLAHSSGLQREPPGEIWETMKAPSREELLAGTADAEQVLQPGSWWHYSNLAYALLGEVVARAHGASWEEALQERILDPLGLTRTTPEESDPSARGYFVEPYSDAVRREPELDLGGSGALGKLWSTTGDLARWGAFLAAGDDRVLAGSTLEEMSHVRTMVDHAGWTLAWGTGLELYRRGEHVFVGHGGAMPGHLAGLVVDRTTKIGAAVLTNTGAGASPEKLALDLAPPELEPLLGPWWTEGHQIVLSWRQGRLAAKLLGGVPGRDTSYLEPDGVDRFRSVEGRERGELLRVVRDEDGAVEKLYFATYPLRREPSTF
jgi:CubicO group peptidase (beta-lactamase class C family)